MTKHSQPRINIPMAVVVLFEILVADCHYLGLHPASTFLIIPHIVGIGVSMEGVHTPSLARKRIALGSLLLRLIAELQQVDRGANDTKPTPKDISNCF